MAYPDLALLIDGRFRTGEGREREPVLNPATGRALADLPHASRADLDQALDASARGFAVWRAKTAAEREAVLRRGADLIRERLEAISETMTLEQGKPIAESRIETAYAADVIEWYAQEGRRAYGRVVPGRVPGVRFLVQPEPVGPAAAFTPWNFPALTPARKIGGALAAGCSLILKPAEETPGAAIALGRALTDAGLPPGVLNIVFGKAADVSAHLIASPIIRKISFTGSIAVGKHLTRLAADGLKRVTMELGGHAPVLVFDDVDPEAVASLLAAGKFRNAGQVCVSPSRFFVQAKSYARFTERFAEVARALKVGDGLEPGVQMGPMANARRVEAMERFTADAVARGATVRAGGARLGNQGFYFQPTVVADPPDDSLLMQEEPFGPIAPIVAFDTLEEAVARANALPYGLAAYAFAASAKTVAAVGRSLEAGMVGVNTLAISNPDTPFGGVKESGLGAEGGVEGLAAYFDTKLIAEG